MSLPFSANPSLLKDLCEVLSRHGYCDLRCPGKADTETLIDQAARNLQVWRNLRARYLPSSVLGEPGYDMLLELFVAEREGRAVAVKSICHASGVPYSTAWRWLHLLEKDGLVAFSSDTEDQRRVMVRLSDQGLQRVRGWIEVCFVSEQPAPPLA